MTMVCPMFRVLWNYRTQKNALGLPSGVQCLRRLERCVRRCAFANGQELETVAASPRAW